MCIRDRLCASAEPYVYEAVTAIFDCGGHSFTAKGKRILSEGWREIDRIFRAFLKEKPADGDGGTLPDLDVYKRQRWNCMCMAV